MTEKGEEIIVDHEIRFLDSFKFMTCALETLVDNLDKLAIYENSTRKIIWTRNIIRTRKIIVLRIYGNYTRDIIWTRIIFLRIYGNSTRKIIWTRIIYGFLQGR